MKLGLYLEKSEDRNFEMLESIKKRLKKIEQETRLAKLIRRPMPQDIPRSLPGDGVIGIIFIKIL